IVTVAPDSAAPTVTEAPPKPAAQQRPAPPTPKPPTAIAPREKPRSAPAEKTVERNAVAPPAVTGGRGAAPDGVAFYSGLTLAGALLAFGLFTFLRIGHDESR